MALNESGTTAAEAEDYAVVAHGVRKYFGAQTVLDQFSLTITAGEFVVL